MEQKRVLFVCSANTCRSAAAEVLLRHRGGSRFQASSAGLYALGGEPMMASVAEALTLLLSTPVSAKDHHSRRLTEEMLRENDLVIGVSEGYASLMRTYFPAYKEKITAFPEGIADLSLLTGEELICGLRRIENGILTLFPEVQDGA